MTLTGPLADLAAPVAALAAADLAVVPAPALAEEITELGHLLDRLEAERLRRLAVFDRAGGAAADGSVTTAAWLRERAGLAPGAARERVTVARELADHRHETAAALAAGRIGYTAAREIAMGLRDAANLVPVEAVAAVERVLVEEAPALAPGDIRRLLSRTLDALVPGALLAREERVQARRGVTLSPLGDAWVLSGTLTAECGAALDTALRALLRAQPAAVDGQPKTPFPQRRHDALHALTRAALDAGTLPEERPELSGEPLQGDRPLRLSDVAGERPHLVVIADWRSLQGAVTAAQAPELHGSGPASRALARRIACDASVTRVITTSTVVEGSAGADCTGAGPPTEPDLVAVRALLPPALGGPVSQPLELGRAYRTVPPPLRRAVLARDRGCRWPGCGLPASRGEVHHVRHWTDGGPTDLGNLVLLCWSHHRLLHEGGWGLELRSDGSVDLTRPDGTPHRQPAAA